MKSNTKRIGRLFLRKTNLTPMDPDVIIDRPPGLFDDYDRILVSVLFSWDVPRAEWLAAQWAAVCEVRIGGPAMGERGEQFEPGRFVRRGAVITSRGCPNRCWFCSVWRREGGFVRELNITEGYNVLDDNLFRCSDGHVQKVFAMLDRQRERAEFTGGLEARALTDYHVGLLADRRKRIKQLFLAYDTPDDREPLQVAAKRLRDCGFTWNQLRCYVLVGYPGDTMEKAESRLKETLNIGAFPMAMLYRNDRNETTRQWRSFQREWARPIYVYQKMKISA